MKMKHYNPFPYRSANNPKIKFQYLYARGIYSGHPHPLFWGDLDWSRKGKKGKKRILCGEGTVLELKCLSFTI